MAERTISVRLRLRLREFSEALQRAWDLSGDLTLDRLQTILTKAELDQVRETVKASRIDPAWAVRIIGFGCPPDKLAEVDLLRQATGGDREGVERWTVVGRLDEALEALRAGRLGAMYEEQP